MTEILEKLKQVLHNGAQETSQEVEVLRATLNPKIREGRYDGAVATIQEITEKQGELKAISKVLRVLEVQIGNSKPQKESEEETSDE